MPFAPTQHTPAAKTRIPTENDFDLRPRLPQPLHQKLQSRPSVPGRVNVGWPQIGHQQLFPAKHIERQETIVTIVTMKERSLLLPMHPIIRGIKIEDQLGGRWRKRSDELVDRIPCSAQAAGRSARFSNRQSVGLEASGWSLRPPFAKLDRAATCRDR